MNDDLYAVYSVQTYRTNKKIKLCYRKKWDMKRTKRIRRKYTIRQRFMFDDYKYIPYIPFAPNPEMVEYHYPEEKPITDVKTTIGMRKFLKKYTRYS